MSIYLRAFVLLMTAIIAVTITSAQDHAKPAARPTAVDDDAEAVGQQTFTENCLICHGEEMAANQRLTTKQWTATIDKMVGWGAPVPPDKKSPLLVYLTSHFSDNAAAAKSDMALPKELVGVHSLVKSTSGDKEQGFALFSKHCATCHGPAAQGGELGTNLIEKSILVNEKAYHEAVRKGVRRMPAFANVLDATAETNLLAWLRARRVP